MESDKKSIEKKNVVIFSNTSDHTTDDVYDWIVHLNHNCLIIKNLYNNVVQVDVLIENNNIALRINGFSVDCVWFRKNWINYRDITNKKREDVRAHLKDEGSVFSSAIISTALDNVKNTLGGNCISKGEMEMNKPLQLMIARKCGLDIPFTLLTNNKKKLIDLFKSKKKFIAKPLSGFFSIGINKNISYNTYTEIISLENIQELKEPIFPCLIQEYIEKEFEIRIFYLKKEIYSAAIFSQLEQQTSVDFRKYIKNKSHRVVPFKLPQDIEKAVSLFMQHSGFDTGSIDMIYTKDGKYIFLEVNPVGQFGMISEPCNYYLERKVAEVLTH